MLLQLSKSALKPRFLTKPNRIGTAVLSCLLTVSVFWFQTGSCLESWLCRQQDERHAVTRPPASSRRGCYIIKVQIVTCAIPRTKGGRVRLVRFEWMSGVGKAEEGWIFGFPIGKRSCRWHMAWTTVQSVICRTMAIVAIRTINERTVLLTPQTGQFSATDEKRKTAGLAEW